MARSPLRFVATGLGHAHSGGRRPGQGRPLLCGGITVFNPLLECGVRPTHKVGVIGIGGLGHLALQFLNKWGCDVTAFTSSASKSDEARRMGAHHVVDSHSTEQLQQLAGAFDFILSTVNANLDWTAYLSALAPKAVSTSWVWCPSRCPSSVPIDCRRAFGGRVAIGCSGHRHNDA